MSDLVKRLRKPPFGTETSELNLMRQAADRIEAQTDALARLRVIYPNLMRLDYDNLRTRTQADLDAPAQTEQKTPLEHFAAFYALQNNQPLSAEQAAFCQQLIETLWKEEDA